MALGAKVVPLAPKKPDPIKEFETGSHLVDGRVLPLVYAADLCKPTTFSFTQGWVEAEKRLTAYAAPQRDAQRELADALPMDASLTKDFLDTKRIANSLGIRVSRTDLEADGVLPRGNPADKLTTGQALDAIDWMLMKIDAAQRPDPAKALFYEPPVSPRQAAVAAKMADVQKAKQELRALTKRG